MSNRYGYIGYLYGNKYGSIPIGYAVMLMEEHDTVKIVLQLLFICCTQFFWKSRSFNYQDLVNELLVNC